jgi:hypothetical protein
MENNPEKTSASLLHFSGFPPVSPVFQDLDPALSGPPSRVLPARVAAFALECLGAFPTRRRGMIPVILSAGALC